MQITAKSGETLLACLQRHHVPVYSLLGRFVNCRGNGLCTLCKVDVAPGAALSPKSLREYLKGPLLKPSERLACRAQIFGGVKLTARDGTPIEISLQRPRPTEAEPTSPATPPPGAKPQIVTIGNRAKSAAPPNRLAPVVPITPAAVRDMLAAPTPPVLIDVREPSEWDDFHLDTAIHIPLGTLKDHLKDLNPAAPTVVYCAAGMRSQAGAAVLVEAGFTTVYNLEGGITRWLAENR